jgi:hypothetical protein
LNELKDMQKKRFEYRNSSITKNADLEAEESSPVTRLNPIGAKAQFPPYHQKNFYG